MANRNAKPPKHAQFKPGQSGNPGGRPKNREELGNAFTNDVLAVWREHGIEGLRKLAKEDPATFAAIAAAQIPKDAQKAIIEHSGAVDHKHVGLSDTAAWIERTLGERAQGAPAEPLPH